MAVPHPDQMSRSVLADRDLDALSLGPSQTSSARVFQELHARIVALKLPPGTILNRAELAEAFGVSQSPVREAILRLESVGLVVSYPQSRTEVTHIAPARLVQENFHRTAMECEIVDRLSRPETGADLTRARGILKSQEALIDDPQQIELFRELDEQFHHALFAAAGHPALHMHLRERSGHMARLRTLDLPRAEKLRSVVEGHTRVMERIQSGDRHGAVDAMRDHLSGTIGRLADIMAAHRSYFA